MRNLKRTGVLLSLMVTMPAVSAAFAEDKLIVIPGRANSQASTPEMRIRIPDLDDLLRKHRGKQNEPAKGTLIPDAVPGALLGWPGLAESELQRQGEVLLPVGRKGHPLIFNNGAVTLASEFADRFLRDCRKSNEFTIHLEFASHQAEQSGPARIFSFSSNTGQRNLTLGQEGKNLIFRLRTPQTDTNGTRPEVTLLPITENFPMALTVTYQPGHLTAYVAGHEVFSTTQVKGDLSNWSPQTLILGNEKTLDRSWRGSLTRLAVFARCLSPQEVQKLQQ